MAEAEVIRIEDRSRGGLPRSSSEAARCRATTSSGRPCRNYAADARGYCKIHSEQERARETHPAAQGGPQPAGKAVMHLPDDALGSLGDFLRRRVAGEYPIDDFGYDRELSRQVLLPLGKWLYERYFRVRTIGIERIPLSGPALLVANHSGTIPLDGAMVAHAVATEHPEKRVVRSIAANLAFRTPFFGHLARKSGAALANDSDARELLARGELVAVYPEGYKGVGKGWAERYRLQRFGRGGFMELALRTRVPIIPVAIVGAEEAYPMIANVKFLARLFGFPYFPVTPTFPLFGPLGALPLPSRWVIEFGEPIPMDVYPPSAADDAMLVFDLADRVRDTIQQMLYRNLRIRGNAFF